MGGGQWIFPEWWEISGRAFGLGGAVGLDGQPIEVRIEDAAAHTVWPIRQMEQERVADLAGADPADERTMLDVAVAAGVQPDVDSDGDGRERFLDTDGDGLVDRCVDGDRTAMDGRACTADPRFADGYDITLLFRLERVEPVAP
ncbi:MAG: hypothetical protein H6719_32900 [Sandaracinaceae bacterium]|nr:hypothetical protein [Sandaracinaceae bacterium]